ncbi:MAG TPA: OsmC family protein, partial [Myxococcota bacterium]|nr:OsmC family protein [Myxococcota bacterium]
MAVNIHLQYKGDLQCEAVHGPSADRLSTDAPVDNHGKGEHFSPTDLLATSLGTCMITTMAIAAQARSIALGNVEADVEKHMGTQPRRHVAKLVVRLRLPSAVPEAHREVLERAAKACPVHASLAPSTEV